MYLNHFLPNDAALASKIWRISRLARGAQQFRRLKLTEKDVLPPFIVLVSANTVILVLWTVLDPLRFVRTYDTGLDEWERPVSSSGSCKSQSTIGISPYLLALMVVNLAAVIFANVQAYLARDLRTEFGESNSLGLIMVVLL